MSIIPRDRIKRKDHEVLDKTKRAVKEKKDQVANKIIARFDATTPDTKFNKEKFQEFFEFYPTPDVKIFIVIQTNWE